MEWALCLGGADNLSFKQNSKECWNNSGWMGGREMELILFKQKLSLAIFMKVKIIFLFELNMASE